jgi:hypothetical protein
MPTNKLDEIKPMSSMQIEPIDPVISQFLDFESFFGGGNPSDKAVPADAVVRSKSAAMRAMHPEAADISLARTNQDDLPGTPSSRAPAPAAFSK